jgi:hypothetical protein
MNQGPNISSLPKIPLVRQESKNFLKNLELSKKRDEINTTLFTAVNNREKGLFLGQLRDQEPRFPHKRAMPPSVCQERDHIGIFRWNA